MEMKFVKLEKKDRVAILKIDRPEALNALNEAVLEGIDKAISDIKADKNLRAVVVTGEGKAFVAGADLAAMSEMSLEEGRAFGIFGSSVFRRLEILDLPTIAAVNGFALGGGCELALSCDIIIAGENAKFGQPEVGLGIPPGFSGTQRLARRIGVGKAKELIYTGAIISASDALEIGLANKIVPKETVLEEAISMAEIIAKMAPIAVRNSKKAIDAGLQVDIDTGIAIENELFAACFASADQKEGMKAFLEKRPASFEGK
jgi:enoyl-CoA hydratase